MKHLEIDFHFIRDLVAKYQLNACHFNYEEQLIDILTKPLVDVCFLFFEDQTYGTFITIISW